MFAVFITKTQGLIKYHRNSLSCFLTANVIDESVQRLFFSSSQLGLHPLQPPCQYKALNKVYEEPPHWATHDRKSYLQLTTHHQGSSLKNSEYSLKTLHTFVTLCCSYIPHSVSFTVKIYWIWRSGHCQKLAALQHSGNVLKEKKKEKKKSYDFSYKRVHDKTMQISYTWKTTPTTEVVFNLK